MDIRLVEEDAQNEQGLQFLADVERMDLKQIMPTEIMARQEIILN